MPDRSTHGLVVAAQALALGVWSLLRAPGLVLLVVIATMAAAVPFGVVLGVRVQDALAHQPAIDLDAEEIDAEWWMAYQANARGLEATFTPAIIGFAAPLSNLSALLDGTAPPSAMLLPLAVSVLLWAFLWGGILDRLQRGAGTLRQVFVAGARHFAAFALLSIIAAAVALLLYATVHVLLFGPVYGVLAGPGTSEPTAFAVRVALYLMFGALLAAVSLTADYGRIALVAGTAGNVAAAVRAAIAFIRAHPGAVLSLYVMTGTLFVLLFAAYGLVDRRAGGWRGVVVAQAFIVGRLAIRLLFAASELKLVALLTPKAGSR